MEQRESGFGWRGILGCGTAGKWFRAAGNFRLWNGEKVISSGGKWPRVGWEGMRGEKAMLIPSAEDSEQKFMIFQAVK